MALGNVSEMIAARLLVAYHLTHQRPMMASFLDALGIAHEDGLIADEELKAPPPRSSATRPALLARPIHLKTSPCISPPWSGRTPRRGAPLADLPESRALARS